MVENGVEGGVAMLASHPELYELILNDETIGILSMDHSAYSPSATDTIVKSSGHLKMIKGFDQIDTEASINGVTAHHVAACLITKKQMECMTVH